MKVSDKYFDEKFNFAGQWDMPSTCGLKIVQKDDISIVLVTELYQDNPGTSVTYAAGSLIKQICDVKHLDINKIKYIECNPSTNSKLSFYDEEMFLVNFIMQDGMPVDLKYRKLSKEEIQNLL